MPVWSAPCTLNTTFLTLCPCPPPSAAPPHAAVSLQIQAFAANGSTWQKKKMSPSQNLFHSLFCRDLKTMVVSSTLMNEVRTI